MKNEATVLTAVAALFLATPCLAEPRPGDGPGAGGKGAQMFQMMDADGDGQISRAEFISHAMERFSKMDANGDGAVSKEEAQAARGAMREKMKEKREEWHQKRSEGMESPVPDAGAE